MQSHQPAGYSCPFCNLVAGGETDRNRQSDVVWSDDATIAFVAAKW